MWCIAKKNLEKKNIFIILYVVQSIMNMKILFY